MAELSKGESKHRHPEIIDEAYEDKKNLGVNGCGWNFNMNT